MRYLPLSDADRSDMLATVGARSIDDIFADIPAPARLKDLIDLPRAKSEMEVERTLSGLASQNLSAGCAPFFCGAGAYRHHVPATVDHIIQRSEYLTAYTPYQPEISQGTLQTLFEFQTQVALLTGMDVANASMYDGSTAMAEAVLMASRVTRRNRAVFAPGLHPHYAESAKMLAQTTDIDIAETDPAVRADTRVIEAIDEDTACVVVQTPNVFGELVDLTPIAKAAHEKGALLIAVVTEIVSLGAVKSPGEMGADIVAAEGQSIGNALNYGGPYVGLFACREKFVRQMPGRVAGETEDSSGERGFVLTLSTREQHIRRGKATSNICTNSGLCALAWTAHMTLLGEAGLRNLALLNHRRAVQLADRLAPLDGVELLNARFFNEFALKLSKPAAEVVEALAQAGVLGGVPYSRLQPEAGMDDILLVAVTETNTDEDFEAFETALKGALS